MRFLVLAYGAGEAFKALPKQEQAELLAHDDVLRARGDLVCAVGAPTVVRAWDGGPVKTSPGPFATGDRPLAGFGLVEAGGLDEAVSLVSRTPCAVAKGAVELWPVTAGGHETSRATREQEIRTLLDARVQATKIRDVPGATLSFAPDAMAFDVVDPLCHKGVDALRKRAETWFSTFSGSLDFESRDLQIAVGGDVAFAHSLNHASGDLVAGGRLDMWWRETLGLKRQGGRWLITHVHDSVPFNPETGKPSLNLKP